MTIFVYFNAFFLVVFSMRVLRSPLGGEWWGRANIGGGSRILGPGFSTPPIPGHPAVSLRWTAGSGVDALKERGGDAAAPGG